MAEITRFSFLYDPAEDRIALDAEDADGAATRLWLTQRLCRGLVAALVPMLTPPASALEDPGRQSWEQAAAVEAMGATPPVHPGPEATVGLVHEVTIAPAGDRLALTLRFSAGQSRELSIATVALRQTLAELHRLHVIAAWPQDLWPAWIADPAGGAAAVGAVN